MWLIMSIPCNQFEGFESVLCSAFGAVQCVLDDTVMRSDFDT